MSHILIETITHKLASFKDIKNFFVDLKNKEYAYYVILDGLYNKINSYDDKEFQKIDLDKYRILLDAVVADLGSINNLDTPTLVRLLFLINCKVINNRLISKNSYSKKLHDDGELRGKVEEAIKENLDDIIGFLFSYEGIFSRKPVVC